MKGRKPELENRAIRAGEGEARGAQLCKTSKAGAASFVEAQAMDSEDGPAHSKD